MTEKKKVLVALSGGVDSSVTAMLLKKQGYEVGGIFMDLGQVAFKESKDAAKKLAKFLKIPFFTVNFKNQFNKEVIKYFLEEYSKGKTPNPCVVCNKKIKLNI